ncbi:MAG: VCBS repeat-containing protein [Pirellulales bacterium]|nr:VCBS repeat-containing protein [Pirellulales bacterium]
MQKPAVQTATFCARSLGIAIVIFYSPAALAAVLNLGPEQIVLAGSEDLFVPGYSVPCFTDFNNDGLDDLVVGEGGSGFDGKIRVYLNGGSTNTPLFSDFVYAQSEGTDLLLPASGCMGAFPRIAHFDADNKKDLLVGRADGTVQLFCNIGTESNPTFDEGTLLEVGTAGFKSPIDVGSRATIALTDWDNNGVRDLVLGALDGYIHLYLNQGTNTEPDFVSETIVQDLYGNLQVPSGRSSPALMDLTGDGNKDLLVGNTNGAILLYTNQGSDSMPSFSTYDYVIADGIAIDLPGVPRSRPFISDWTGDGLPDLLIGAGDGRIHLFQSVPEEADFDEDGDVDANDFAIWQSGFSTINGASHGDGDADADRDVDGYDFLIWQRAYSSGSLSLISIPEPSTLILCAFPAFLALVPTSCRKKLV